MSDPALIATLKRLEEHLSLAIHEATRQRTTIQEALTRLRTGQDARVAAAIIETTCPELTEAMGR